MSLGSRGWGVGACFGERVVLKGWDMLETNTSFLVVSGIEEIEIEHNTTNLVGINETV